ncbi:ABC transporter permease [Acidisoma cellulosilytica]|uniref:ABC transporter permease n=1 Tax=Acidisoma cellulosilyticum TaxID=2802395 RepID=A0A964E6H8_9PROT|nr:ABC transporter permease [Acidisoma cellulosilyticum]MCB8883755.1 ABC transporter permease [Acidisoma cellulosilyticum]
MTASVITTPIPRTLSGRLAGHVNELGLIGIIVLLYAIFGFISPGFLSANNQVNILRDGSAIGIAAWAQTLVIVAGEIDISVGPMVAFISVLMAFALKWHMPLAVSLCGGLVLGALLGSVAGVLRGIFNVPSFVATLGLWSALRGLALFMTNALPVSFDDNDTLDWIGDNVFGIPVSAVVMIILFAIFVFVSRKTALGRSVYAVGGNASAARLCGINVTGIRILVFTLSGLMAAVTAIMLLARLGTGNAGAASGLEFDVIAGVVVGGTSLTGGRGSMLGTLLGVLAITVIGDGLVLYGINSFVQDVVRGVIIVAAVLLNVAAARRSGRAGR